MFTAMVTCNLLLRRRQASLPLPTWQKTGLALGGFCGAMIGSKIPFVLSDWEGMLNGLAWFAHGKTIMCGIVGGYFGVEIAKWTMEIRIKTGDTFAAPVAVAVAIGRVACFNGGCCYGVETTLPWGVVFPTAITSPLLSRHPTQLYEAVFHLLAAIALAWMDRRGMFRGQLIKLYILTYLAYRFVTEFIRPEPQILFGLTGYQWAALVLVPLFVGLWIRDSKLGIQEGESLAPAVEG